MAVSLRPSVILCRLWTMWRQQVAAMLLPSTGTFRILWCLIVLVGAACDVAARKRTFTDNPRKFSSRNNGKGVSVAAGPERDTEFGTRGKSKWRTRRKSYVKGVRCWISFMSQILTFVIVILKTHCAPKKSRRHCFSYHPNKLTFAMSRRSINSYVSY